MKNISIRSIILSLSITAIIVTAPFAQAEPAITIEATNIDTLISELTTAAQQLAPQVPTTMLPSAIGMAIKNPGLIDIDRKKPVQMQIALPTTSTDPLITLHFPLLNNGKNYLTVLEQSTAKPTVTDGVYAFKSATGETVYIAIANSYAIISDSSDAIKAAKTSKGISSATLLDISGTLRIGITPKELIPFLKANAKNVEAAMSQQPATPGMDMDTGKIVTAEVDALIAILEQIEAMAIGININKGSIDINSKANTVAGSIIAKINSQLKVPSAKYSSLAPANALYATSGSGMDSLDLIIEPYSKFITDIYGAMGSELSTLAPTLCKSMEAYKGLYSGDYAVGVINSGKTIGLYQVVALTDAAKAKKITDTQLALSNESFKKSMGMTMDLTEARTYKGIKVQALTYKVGDTMMGMPTPPSTKAILNSLKTEIAYTDSDMIYTVGDQKTMNTILDRLAAKTGAASSTQFTKLIPTVQGKPVQQYTLSIAKIIKSLLLLSPTVNDTMFASNTKTDGLAGYLTATGKDIVGFDRISFNEILAIKELIPTIQKTLFTLIMQQQM